MSDQFPGWYYGPNGESQIFNSIEEVPEGWEDHPSKVKEPQVGKGEQNVSKSESKRVAEQKNTKKTPKTKEEVVASIVPPESVGDSPDPVVAPVEGTVGDEGASTEESDEPMTEEEATEKLLKKGGSELREMAKLLGVDEKGSKNDLVARIVPKLMEEQANEAEKPL